MLLTSFYSGVHDMVVAPSVALLNSPTDPSRAGLILAQGTLSMVSHSTSGFFGTLARVSASAGQGVATMSFDPDFREWHRKEVLADATNINRDWKKRGVQNLGLMVARPIADIVLGVTGGVSGVIIAPVRGYRRNGNRGLAEGAFIGFVGLFARPVVGFLDSFSHFAGSIHDIAKSVNVLDKRVLPVKRLRLPYAFSMMSILVPYNTEAARAQKLLKRFPLHSNNSSSEVIVHVEILAGTETETLIVASTKRVVVMRVTWDSAGISTLSLCWQGAFSPTETVSSVLDEHDRGHGSSLTLLKRIKANNKTSDGEEPVVAKQRSHLSAFRVGFPTPKIKKPDTQSSPREGDAVKEKTEKQTSADDQFTVLGEYRFRHQLIKIHNAICCITECFDRLVYDHTMEESVSKDGFLSFGPFCFQKVTPDEPCGHIVLPEEMEDLPWISRECLSECQSGSPSEQKLFLHSLREKWTLQDEIESSRLEGGPEWLVQIRAKSRYVKVEQWNPRSFQPAKKLSFDESDDKVPSMTSREKPENEPNFLPMESLHRYVTATNIGTSNDVEQNMMSSSLSPRKRGISDHQLVDLDSTTSTEVSGNFNHRRRDPEIHSSFATAQANTESPVSPSFTQIERHTRLDRMERLMEQLLSLTTQLTREKIEATTCSEIAELREQIEVLRQELQRGQVQEEIIALRSEVDTLRERLHLFDTKNEDEKERNLEEPNEVEEESFRD